MKRIKLAAVLLFASACLFSCSKKSSTPLPGVGFSYHASGDAPATVAFTNESTNATSYIWNFGDGSATSTAVNPSHVYIQSGEYTVTITATNETGSNTLHATINIQATTSLQVVVNDSLGHILQDATVTIYASQSDYNSKSNAVASVLTNSAGIASFVGLSTIQYFFDVQYGCENNIVGKISTTSSLQDHTQTTSTVIVVSEGTIKLVNTSSNSYQIYVDGTIIISNMAGNTTRLVPYKWGGHSIRVLQLNGYAIYPTDQTYTGILPCGGTLTTTFP